MIELIFTDKEKVRETQQAPFLGRRPPQPSANVFATVAIRLLSANGGSSQAHGNVFAISGPSSVEGGSEAGALA
jgi:hypothetical protein